MLVLLGVVGAGLAMFGDAEGLAAGSSILVGVAFRVRWLKAATPRLVADELGVTFPRQRPGLDPIDWSEITGVRPMLDSRAIPFVVLRFTDPDRVDGFIRARWRQFPAHQVYEDDELPVSLDHCGLDFHDLEALCGALLEHRHRRVDEELRRVLAAAAVGER